MIKMLDLKSTPTVRSVATVIIAMFLLPWLALADRVGIYGLDFTVEHIENTQLKATEVLIFGEKHLVAPAEVHYLVVKSYFNPQDSVGTEKRIASFTLHDLSEFYRKAFEARNERIGSLALFALVVHPDSSLASIDELLWGQQELNAVGEFVAAALGHMETFRSTKNTDFPLLTLLPWTHLASKETLNKHIDSNRLKDFSRYYQERVIKNLFEGKAEETDKLLKETEFILDDEPEVRSQLRTLVGIVPEMLEELREGRQTLIIKLRNLLGPNSKLERSFAPAFTDFINAMADTSLVRGNHKRALWLLAKTNPQFRTPTTHRLTLNSLTQLNPSEPNTPILQTGVSSFLAKMSELDEEIKSTYLLKLEQQMKEMLVSSSPERFDIFFGLFLALNPDPHERNDQLRVTKARRYFDLGETQIGLQVLDSLQGGLNPIEAKKILLLKMWKRYPLLFMIFSLALATIIVAMVVKIFLFIQRRKKRVGKRETSNAGKADKRSPKNLEEIPLFVRSGVSTPLSPIALEYMQLLTTFRLKPGASVQDVKRAYRGLVKNYHPDSATAETNEESHTELLTKAKDAYDRLIEMEKEGLISIEDKLALKRKHDLGQIW